MLTYVFNERKAAQAAAHLLRRGGGTLYYLHLIKLLYLADRKTFLETGLPLTGDRWFSMKNGPVLSAVLDLIREDKPDKTAWADHVIPLQNHQVGLCSGAVDEDELSEAEIAILDEVFDQYGRMDRFKLCNLTHLMCPEWRDSGDSRLPIQPRDILRAEGKSESEIEAFEDACDASLFLEMIK